MWVKRQGRACFAAVVDTAEKIVWPLDERREGAGRGEASELHGEPLRCNGGGRRRGDGGRKSCDQRRGLRTSKHRTEWKAEREVRKVCWGWRRDA